MLPYQRLSSNKGSGFMDCTLYRYKTLLLLYSSGTRTNHPKMVNPETGWCADVTKRADSNGICLCTVDELPPWHFQHRGIRNGYRYCRGFTSAIVSTLYWHNETVNIWSHIIASLAILVFFFFKLPAIMEVEHDSFIDKPIIIFVVICGNVIHLLTSAMCHNFYCIDKVSF